MIYGIGNAFFKKDHEEQHVATLLGSGPSAFLCDGALHQQHNEHKRDHDNGQHPEYIEVGERRCLLLAQVCERLQGQLLRGDRIAGLLQERPGSLMKEGARSQIEGIEPFAKTQAVELVTALLNGLRHRGSHATTLVAQEAQQADRRPAQRERRIEVSRDVCGGSTSPAR
jgi:hypothetical protein